MSSSDIDAELVAAEAELHEAEQELQYQNQLNQMKNTETTENIQTQQTHENTEQAEEEYADEQYEADQQTVTAEENTLIETESEPNVGTETETNEQTVTELIDADEYADDQEELLKTQQVDEQTIVTQETPATVKKQQKDGKTIKHYMQFDCWFIMLSY